jgi:hypothetical protein
MVNGLPVHFLAMPDAPRKRHGVKRVRKDWFESHVACPKCGQEIYIEGRVGIARRKGRIVRAE